MSTLALVVDWHGPFASVADAQAAPQQNEVFEVLYLATGRCKYERVSRMQYVGISNDLNNRFNDPKHTVSLDIARDLRIWIGVVVSHGVAGRKAASGPISHTLGVEITEWALAYFLQLPLNTRKRRTPPRRSFALINRWYKKDFSTRWSNKKAHTKDWPDFIEYDPSYGVAILQWFGAPPRRRKFDEEEIKALALPKAVKKP